MFPGIDKLMTMGRELLEQLHGLRSDMRELTAELRRSRDKV